MWLIFFFFFFCIVLSNEKIIMWINCILWFLLRWLSFQDQTSPLFEMIVYTRPNLPIIWDDCLYKTKPPHYLRWLSIQDQTSPSFEMIVTCKWFLHVCKQDIIEILKDEYMVWNIIFIYHHVKYNSYVCIASWLTKSCSIGDYNFKFTFKSFCWSIKHLILNILYTTLLLIIISQYIFSI
jgi:hypothetical protein